MAKLGNEIRVNVTPTLLGRTIRELREELDCLNDHDRSLFETLKKTMKSAAHLHSPLGIAALTIAFMELSEELK